MTVEQTITDLVTATNTLTNTVNGKIAAIDAEVAAKKTEVDNALNQLSQSSPVTPNLLVDTKYFSHLCGGATNTSQELIAAHGSPWSACLYNGTTGSGTLEIVTLDKLQSQGLTAGGDLLKALGETGQPGELFHGSDFHVALFDVQITGDQSNGDAGYFFIMNQGGSLFTGWYHGEFKTQASCFVNVIEHSGDIVYYPHDNMPARVAVTGDDLDQGWLYKHATRNGWGGCHQPHFRHQGHMTVALALPYIGYGDNGNQFIWAGSVGRYSHTDHLAAGFTY